MGRDNHPRERQLRKLARKNGARPRYDRILIVCEGKKTEPNYFNAIKQYGHLSSAQVKSISSEYGTSPQQVVDFALDYCKDNKSWETVFCVFDRDDHLSFENAIKSAESKRDKLKNDQGEAIQIVPIPSVPCFELWLFLHFEACLAEIERSDLYARLKKYLPGYEKGLASHFDATKEHLRRAHENAAKIKRNRAGCKIANPYTDVDVVVRKLMDLVKLQRQYRNSKNR